MAPLWGEGGRFCTYLAFSIWSPIPALSTWWDYMSKLTELALSHFSRWAFKIRSTPSPQSPFYSLIGRVTLLVCMTWLPLQAARSVFQWREDLFSGQNRGRGGQIRPGRGAFSSTCTHQILILFLCLFHLHEPTQICASYTVGAGPDWPVAAVRSFPKAREQIFPSLRRLQHADTLPGDTVVAALVLPLLLHNHAGC